jgi:hypothetical protein
VSLPFAQVAVHEVSGPLTTFVILSPVVWHPEQPLSQEVALKVFVAVDFNVPSVLNQLDGLVEKEPPAGFL